MESIILNDLIGSLIAGRGIEKGGVVRTFCPPDSNRYSGLSPTVDFFETYLVNPSQFQGSDDARIVLKTERKAQREQFDQNKGVASVIFVVGVA
jgi:hypothetical protein